MQKGSKEGNLLILNCKDKFSLTGSAAIQCLRNGEWSGHKAQCIRKIIRK